MLVIYIIEQIIDAHIEVDDDYTLQYGKVNIKMYANMEINSDSFYLLGEENDSDGGTSHYFTSPKKLNEYIDNLFESLEKLFKTKVKCLGNNLYQFGK